jgi:hypothetical protein
MSVSRRCYPVSMVSEMHDLKFRLISILISAMAVGFTLDGKGDV